MGSLLTRFSDLDANDENDGEDGGDATRDVGDESYREDRTTAGLYVLPLV
jgi:hypothetical protein